MNFQPIAWHHLACDIPADWEISRYAIEPRAGRLEFAGRRRPQALLAWEPCRREPDRRATMLAFLRRQVLDAGGGRPPPEEGFRSLGTGPFLVGWHDALPRVQALAWLPASRHLLRWIFEDGRTAEGTPAPWVARVLGSFRPNDGDPRRYRLFGLHLLLPAHYEIERMAVFPANVMIAFEGRDKRRITARRWGLPEHLLGGRSLAAFHTAILAADGARVRQSAATRLGPHEACRLRYSQRPSHHMERYFGRDWTNGEALIWHDRDTARIHACEQIGPDRSPPLDFAAILPDAAPPA